MCSAHMASRWLGRLFGKLFSSAFSGPPLGRPAWLCPGPAKMEKKIAAKISKLGPKRSPEGPTSLQNGAWRLLGGLGAPCLLGSPGVPWSPPGRLLERIGRLRNRVWPKSQASSTVQRFSRFLRPPGDLLGDPGPPLESSERLWGAFGGID